MKDQKIDFIQLNLKKAFAAAVELNSSIKKTKDYICLITEPFLNRGKISLQPPGSKIIL